jgi:hypothetical protein
MRTLIGLGMAVGVPILLARLVLRSRGHELSDEVDLVAVASRSTLRPRSPNFLGGNCLAVLGLLHLDLRRAALAPTGAELNILTVAAAATVVVPDEWRVSVYQRRRMASMVRSPSSPASLDAPHLEIRSSTFLGALDIAHRPRLEAVPA